jgi:hypothetical protein
MRPRAQRLEDGTAFEISPLLEPGVILGAIFFASRWLNSDMRSLEQRLSHEHEALDAKFTERFKSIDGRFDIIERQNRRRLRAVIDADL